MGRLGEGMCGGMCGGRRLDRRRPQPELEYNAARPRILPDLLSPLLPPPPPLLLPSSSPPPPLLLRPLPFLPLVSPFARPAQIGRVAPRLALTLARHARQLEVHPCLVVLDRLHQVNHAGEDVLLDQDLDRLHGKLDGRGAQHATPRMVVLEPHTQARPRLATGPAVAVHTRRSLPAWRERSAAGGESDAPTRGEGASRDACRDACSDAARWAALDEGSPAGQSARGEQDGNCTEA